MAAFNLAGSFDPSTATRLGWNQAAFSNTAPPVDPAAINSASSFDSEKLWNQGLQDLVKNAEKDPNGIATLLGLAALGPSPRQRREASELRRQETKESLEMQRQNYEFINKLAKEKEIRDQLRQLPREIAGAFSPMPWSATQEVVGNIANIASPQNIRSITLPQAGGVGLPARNYFG
jgi:hypothetical protein